MKLYRATADQTDAETIPAGTCWTPEEETAEAYTDNPGFGGEHIVSIEVDMDGARVLDVRGRNARDLSALASALGMEASDWRDDGLDSVFAVLENRRKVAAAVAELADWIIYSDDFPENATTYRKL